MMLRGLNFDASWRVLAVTIAHGLLSFLGLYAVTPAVADIRFEEVTQSVGIRHSGETWGASWGDFNNDGWPDLWVGNHASKPSLYLNQRGKTFIDVIDKVWAENPRADKHGAAWADFDNDGDQDLVELVDVLINEDGTLSKGLGRNLLFVNENGKLVNKAKEFGLDSTGQGRTPLWFDADRDGRLDLLVVNTRTKGQPTSAIFHQGPDGFKESNKEFGFRDDERSRWDRLRDLLHNVLRFHFAESPLLYMSPHFVFGQIADLFGDGALKLIVFSSPTRVYSMSRIPFTDVTATVGFPSINNRSAFSIPRVDLVSDVAIEDFNGDGKLDMYLTRGERYVSDVIQVNSKKLIGTLEGMQGSGSQKTILFRSEGRIDIEIYPPWRSLSEIFIGSMGRHPSSRSFSLSPEDSKVSGPVPTDMTKSRGLFITFDPRTRVWTLHSSHPGNFDFIVHSATPINNLQTLGFQPFQEEGVDALLIRQGNGYVLQELPGDAGAPTSCHSVVAGDFDNDMDIDLYLVCTGPVNNLPDRLLENDGKGRFKLVPNAGGASIIQLGRGDAAVVADYDRDGFLDLFITNGLDPTSPFTKDGPHQLFHNRGNNNHWLEIDLEGVKTNRDGIGASIILEAGGTRQIREQRGGMHLLSQNHQRVHFGLGKNSMVDRLTIRWPSGIVQEIGSMAADRILKIREGAGLVRN
jgi:hypothetical protein